MFAPSRKSLTVPLAIFTDYTMRLAWENYRPWAPFATQIEADAYFERETALYQRASRIFTPSEYARHALIQYHGVAPSVVFKTGFGVPAGLPTAPGGNRDGRTILFVGKEWERKGGPTLVEAFGLVRDRIPDARLKVVGPTRPQTDSANVEWLGAISNRSHLMRLYAESAVFVMPSLCEPFGLVFLEAMAHHLPCVGTNTDAIPEIIVHGETGLLVPVGDVEALAEALSELLAHPLRAAEMGVRGASRVASAFSWDNLGDVIDTQLRQLTE
jgi:glycosyltransferase involved in cell wall biosynthesis